MAGSRCRFLGLPLLVLLSAAVPPLAAQTASLVRDLSPSGEVSDVGSEPSALQAAGGKVFFDARETGAGFELWVTDGTPGGTEQLAGSCQERCWGDSLPLGSVGGTIFRAVGDTVWRSDGTRPGTFPVTPPGVELPDATRRSASAVAAGRLFFAGCTEEAGCEPWRSDGTPEGTRLLADLSPGIQDSNLDLLAVGNKVFIVAHDFYQGGTLWVTDGPAADPVMVRQFESGSILSPIVAGSRLFFALKTPEAGTELWASDGTPQGTLELTHFPDADPFAVDDFFATPLLQAAGRHLYFVADDSVHGPELWQSDGTVAGTRRITGFETDQPFRVEPRFVEEVGDRVVFIATDGVTLRKVWTSRGTPESVVPLADPCHGGCEFLPDKPELFKVGDRIFFVANDGAHGDEPWVSDGTPGGTAMLRDICPGACPAFFIDDFQPLAGKILFTARTAAVSRSNLWVSDGTPAGTRQITEPGKSPSIPIRPLQGAAASGRIFFVGVDSRGNELWVSESGGGVHLVADIARQEPSSTLEDFVPFHGRLFFGAADDDGLRGEVWQSDGTAAETFPVTSGSAGDLWFSPNSLAVAGDALFFLTNLFSEGGQDLWRTDGTAAGTFPLLQDRTSIVGLTAVQDRVWFAVPTGDSAHPVFEVWRSDGTPQGTVRIASLPEGEFPSDFKAAGDELYFLTGSSFPRQLWHGGGGGVTKIADLGVTAKDPQLLRLGSRVFFLAAGHLWTTDGTASGTQQVTGEGPYFQRLVPFGGALYLLGGDASGAGLWRSDGTAAGTVRLATFTGRTPVYQSSPLVAAAGRLFFTAEDGAHGIELWTSDGTEAGTVLVRDVFAGPGSSRPAELTPAGGRLFFSADDGVHGAELWQSDGTAAGTRLVQDIAPQSASSAPQHLTVAGDRLFFSAWENTAGRELWSLPLTGSGCQPSATTLCLSGGRFRVEAVWRDFQRHTGAGQAKALTADTGTFWFFDPANVEVIVKVLDGRGLNQHLWVFYGALSNVEYTLTVTDTETGLTRRYHNPAGQLASVGDTHAFGPAGAAAAKAGIAMADPSPPPVVTERLDPAAATGSCQAGPRRLCLNGGRFAVEATWRDFAGHTGDGTAVPLSADTGYFWFFGGDNVEVVLKVLDGLAVNGKHWVFYGALSNVEYTLTVTDTQTGKVRTYRNPSGRFASVADTAAF